MKYKFEVILGIVVTVVIAAVVWGLYVIGSPEKARMRRFDDLRLQHMQQLQSEILSYWQAKEKLPATLSELKDDLRGVTVPADPETDAAYEYQKKGDEAFSLCADFALSSEERRLYDKEMSYPMYGPYGPYVREQNWEHGSGRHCFDRTIDKERYLKDQEAVKRGAPVPVY
jgi:hypothetical protein